MTGCIDADHGSAAVVPATLQVSEPNRVRTLRERLSLGRGLPLRLNSNGCLFGWNRSGRNNGGMVFGTGGSGGVVFGTGGSGGLVFADVSDGTGGGDDRSSSFL